MRAENTKVTSRWLKIVLLSGSIGLLAMFAGCKTAMTGAKIEARIQEMPEVFAQLPKAAQKDIRWGYIKKGFTPPMVYMALGNPEKTEVSEDKTRITWTYYDDTVVSQEVAMRSAAAEAGSAYSAANFRTRGDSPPAAPGEPKSSRQAFDERGMPGAESYTEDTHAAKVLVIFDQGKVMAVHRIESTPRDERFEDALR